MPTGPHERAAGRRLHARRSGTLGELLRRHRLGWMALVLLGVAALMPGAPISSTFANSWTAENDYVGSSFAAGSLSAPTGLTVAPSGSSMVLSWTNGTNGNADDVAVSAPASSSSCSSSTSVSPLTTLASSATRFTDASSAIAVDTSGDWLCYQLLTGYGAATTGITTQIGVGTTVSSIDLSSAPDAISSGDTITLTNASGESQSFAASVAVAASNGAVTVPVSGSPSAAYSFPTTGTTAYDATGWTSWTSSSTAATSYAAAQVGLVATKVAIANGGTAGRIDSGDKVTITFNQVPNLSAITKYTTACALAGTPGEVILGDETVGSGSCASGDVAAFGTLDANVALTNSLRYSVTYALSGSILTITFGASSTPGTYSTIAANPTWTYVPPTSGFSSSATPAVAVCSAASLCRPATTTSF